MLQDDLFEWHFTIRGPKDTEFDGGIYHGRILLPAEFPYRPPDIIFLTVRNLTIPRLPLPFDGTLRLSMHSNMVV